MKLTYSPWDSWIKDDLIAPTVTTKKTTITGNPSVSSTITVDTGLTRTSTSTTIKPNQFFDDEMLDYLLEDIMKQKAKDAEEKLKKEIVENKKKKIKDFINTIDRVCFNDPATIIFWKNGTKTVVKCQDGEPYDPEKGLAFAIIKSLFGDISYYNAIFKKFIITEDN